MSDIKYCNECGLEFPDASCEMCETYMHFLCTEIPDKIVCSTCAEDEVNHPVSAMNKIDVTNKVFHDWSDGEFLSMTQCVCGEEFASWHWIIGIYPEYATPCPKCGRKFYWSTKITVWQVEP